MSLIAAKVTNCFFIGTVSAAVVKAVASATLTACLLCSPNDIDVRACTVVVHLRVPVVLCVATNLCRMLCHC